MDLCGFLFLVYLFLKWITIFSAFSLKSAKKDFVSDIHHKFLLSLFLGSRNIHIFSCVKLISHVSFVRYDSASQGQTSTLSSALRLSGTQHCAYKDQSQHRGKSHSTPAVGRWLVNQCSGISLPAETELLVIQSLAISHCIWDLPGALHHSWTPSLRSWAINPINPYAHSNPCLAWLVPGRMMFYAFLRVPISVISLSDFRKWIEEFKKKKNR